MKTTNNIFKTLIYILLLLLLSSCDEVGLLSDKNKYLVDVITNPSSFFGVLITLQLSILLTGVLLGLFIGKGGYSISQLIHFVWIIAYRDYGFWNVLLLFIVFTVVNLLYRFVSTLIKANKYK